MHDYGQGVTSMRNVRQYKGFVIATESKREGYFYVFTTEEYEYGNGCRYHEWEAQNIQECIDFIDSY